MTTTDQNQNRESFEAPVMRPMSEVFVSKPVVEEKIMAKGMMMPIFERVDYPYDGGIHVWYKGMPFPKKGFPYPEAVHANDTFKRVVVTLIKSIGNKAMILPILSFAILPWSVKIKAIQIMIENVNRIGEWLLQTHRLKEERFEDACRGVRTFIIDFLFGLGIKRSTAMGTGWVIAMMFEYDDSYRYRLEDMMSETTRAALLADPRKEILRLIQIYKTRELTHAVKLVNSFEILFRIISLHPKVKLALKLAFNSMSDLEFKFMQLDNADRYHVLLRGDYNFTGKSYEERKQIYIDFHEEKKLPYPPFLEVA